MDVAVEVSQQNGHSKVRQAQKVPWSLSEARKKNGSDIRAKPDDRKPRHHGTHLYEGQQNKQMTHVSLPTNRRVIPTCTCELYQSDEKEDTKG